MNNKVIAVTVALVVVFGIFFKNFYVSSSDGTIGDKMGSSPLSLNFFPAKLSFKIPTLSFSNTKTDPVAVEAWGVLQNYFNAAKNHDLEQIKMLSTQISPTCADATKTVECNGLMDSVAYFGESLKQSDFPNIVYDDKQLILSTNYLESDTATSGSKIELYFTRTPGGEPRLLSIRFCYDAKDDFTCANTDPSTRDKDSDGWWDDIEKLFNK